MESDYFALECISGLGIFLLKFGSSCKVATTGPSQRTSQLQSLITDSLCRSLDVAFVDPERNLREIGLDSFAAMSFIACMLRVELELDISLHDITANPSVRLLVDNLVEKDSAKSRIDEDKAKLDSLIRGSLCKSLGVESVDGDRSLRELGLDSFTYMAFMANMLRHEPDMSISMRDVMACPTMTALIEHFTDKASPKACVNECDGKSYVVLDLAMSQSPLQGLASSMQKRFYLLQEQLGDSTYSLPSWDVVLRRHSIFRTIFMPLPTPTTRSDKTLQDGIRLVQVILKPNALPIPLIQRGKQSKPMQPGFKKQLLSIPHY